MTQKTKKLGSNPLDWIGKKPQSLTDSVKTHSSDEEISQKKSKPKEREKELEEKVEEKRETFIIKTKYSEKIKDFAYWERLKQKDAIDIIMEEFFKSKNIKPRPDTK